MSPARFELTLNRHERPVLPLNYRLPYVSLKLKKITPKGLEPLIDRF